MSSTYYSSVSRFCARNNCGIFKRFSLSPAGTQYGCHQIRSIRCSPLRRGTVETPLSQTAATMSQTVNPSCKVPEAVQMLLLQQEQAANKLLDTGRYITDGRFAKQVGYWLLCSAGLVAGVICFGGYTRLTEAGLSITEWGLAGKGYPQRSEDWEEEFEKYKKTLEYEKVHHGMTLDEFKSIYFNEWFHRMTARGSSLFFAGGAVYYGLVKRVFTPRMACTVTGLFSLFVCQGLVGWWMVKSGFEERKEQIKTPRVSPYRLATHLFSASVLLSCLLWSSFSLLLPPSFLHLSSASCAAAIQARRVALLLFPFTPLTFMSGAFVAGNDSGRSNNTWPKMIDRWIPKEVYEIFSNWKHIFENESVVQFDHRLLAYATVCANGAWFMYCRSLPLSPKPRRFAHLMAQIAGTQVMLGIATLLMYVPVPLGVLHQALGLGLLSACVLSSHSLRMPVWYLRSLRT